MQNAALLAPRVRRKKMLSLPSASGNPYQALLYSEIGQDFQTKFAGPKGLGRVTERDFDVLHIHWDDRMFGQEEDDATNDQVLRQARALITDFQARGGRVVWTIHNGQPHKEKNIDAFKSGREMLSEVADVIHVHADHACDHMVNTYGVARDRIVTIPHPSYLGAYEPASRTLARRLVKEETRQFLFFGMLRRAKGIHVIREATAKLTRREVPYHLRMYGKAFKSQERFVKQMRANPNIDMRTDRIDDAEIPAIFAASQVYLAPVQSLFTSGSIMLALSFGLPVIGPDTREMRETTPEECHHLLYPPEAPRGLIRSMRAAVAMSRKDLLEARRACFRFAQDRSPQNIGQQMRALLEGVTDRPAQTGR